NRRRRRGGCVFAAMSPSDKRLFLLFAAVVVSLTLFYTQHFIYAAFIFICCSLCYCHCEEPFPARFGLNPRSGLKNAAGHQRWFWGWGAGGGSVSSRSKTKVARAEGPQRRSDTQALFSSSIMFSPQDFLMGSYISKTHRAGTNPRDQLRDRLSRPNHAVCTPNRRLSFTGDSPGAGSVGRFTLTPQRHYPLQQRGVAPVGVLPLSTWNGFSKKNVLSPRSCAAALSPVTVKIARPDHCTSSLDPARCTRLPSELADPCSREAILKVLRESRKRDMNHIDDDDGRTCRAEQKSKRRRNNSVGSAHTASESLLPTGASSQQGSETGRLKRGMPPVTEDFNMKRSRTSSISSGSGIHVSTRGSGTSRNAIYSSYSSSQGLSQWKKQSASSSPLSSLESSRAETPERTIIRPSVDEGQCPTSASSVQQDQHVAVETTAMAKKSPVPVDQVSASAHSAGGSGRRKRKIQLVPSHREDHIPLPSYPELDCTVTVEALDGDRRAAISRILKALETPSPDPEKSVSPPPGSVQTTSSTSIAPIPSTVVTVINLDPSPDVGLSSSSAAAPVPQLEALKAESATVATVSAVSTLGETRNSVVSRPTGFPQLRPASGDQPFAFDQVVVQTSKAPSSTSTVAGSGLFGPLFTDSSACNQSTTHTTVSSTEPVSTTNCLLSSGFKPIFSVNTPTSGTTESEPTVQNLKLIFGSTTEGTSNRQSASFMVTSPAPSTTSSGTSLVQALTTGNTFTCGTTTSSAPSVVLTGAATTSNNSMFTFSSSQTAAQNAFGFDQGASSQSPMATSPGGLALAKTTSTAAVATTTQTTNSFGKSPFETTAAPSAFSSSSTQHNNLMTFGGSVTSSTPASNSSSDRFTLGNTGFGSNSVGAPFVGTTTPAAAPGFTFEHRLSQYLWTQVQAAYLFGHCFFTGTMSSPAGPFGSAVSPGSGFSTVAFGSPAAPSFSIGSGSKPAGARQRLQARRQHNRKK
ncbi:nuclear envelope pore membrane protein POM 121, partial [Thalassophryne amazonica]|uniref:nuclear envelope pore membrane protein POM 121 n=1 Tax=Thalassophryne amazonica TaxID=390379 RepID=UPI0014708DD6